MKAYLASYRVTKVIAATLILLTMSTIRKKKIKNKRLALQYQDSNGKSLLKFCDTRGTESEYKREHPEILLKTEPNRAALN